MCMEEEVFLLPQLLVTGETDRQHHDGGYCGGGIPRSEFKRRKWSGKKPWRSGQLMQGMGVEGVPTRQETKSILSRGSGTQRA